MDKEQIEKIKLKHEKIRNILMDANCPEFGDVIIDDICGVFDYPNTNIYYEEE